MALTDTAVKKAEGREKPYKMADSGGLYLYVAPSGLKSWRMKFKVGGQEKLLTFGPHPDVKLSEARERRDDTRRRLREGVDPSGARKRAEEARAAGRAEQARLLTFEEAARRWWDMQRGRWTPVHRADVLTSLERDVFPSLGARALVAIKARTFWQRCALWKAGARSRRPRGCASASRRCTICTSPRA